MSSIFISNPPSEIDLLRFKATADAFGGLQKSARFIVRILPEGSLLGRLNQEIFRDIQFLTEIAEMPGRGFMNMDVRYYGPNHKLPFQSTYEDISFTFMCRNGSFEKEFFDDWMEIINPTNHFNFSYRDEYRSTIEIFQYSEVGEVGKPVADYKVTIHNAYPIFVNPQPMTWSDTLLQKLIVNFTYTHWSRDKDPKPRNGEDGYSFKLVEEEFLR